MKPAIVLLRVLKRDPLEDDGGFCVEFDGGWVKLSCEKFCRKGRQSSGDCGQKGASVGCRKPDSEDVEAKAKGKAEQLLRVERSY